MEQGWGAHPIGAGGHSDDDLQCSVPPEEPFLMSRSRTALSSPPGPPPEVLWEVAEAWGRAQEPLPAGLELDFESEPALGRASIPSFKFLSALREKDAPTADRFFTTLVARAAADPEADANTVSLLVSYVFTPFKYFTSYKTSGTGMASGPDTPAQDVAPALRSSLMRAAAQILLRPTTPQEYDNTSAGRTGSYIIIKRLLPLFDQHAPDLTAALNARAASLLPDVPERLRAAEAEGGFSLTPKPAPRDPVQAALERAERTTGTAERDEMYAVAALNATFRNDPRAPEIVDRIVDADLLRRVRSFTDFAFVPERAQQEGRGGGGRPREKGRPHAPATRVDFRARG